MGFDKDRFIAGFAGSLAFQVLHPLDVLRIRLQSIDSSQFNNIPYPRQYKQIFSQMISKEGKWTLYRGTLFSISMNIFLGVFFMMNERLKKGLEHYSFFQNHKKLKFFMSSSFLSFFFAALYSPFYVIKTWILLDINKYKHSLSTSQAVKQIYVQGGLRGFYRGFFPTVIMALNGTMTVSLNDIFRTQFDHVYSQYWGNFMLGGMARLLSSTILYPFNTIRTKLMQNQQFEGLKELKYKNMLICTVKIYQLDGMKGFFQGYLAYAPKSFLSSAMLFTVYEKTYEYLNKNKKK